MEDHFLIKKPWGLPGPKAERQGGSTPAQTPIILISAALLGVCLSSFLLLQLQTHSLCFCSEDSSGYRCNSDHHSIVCETGLELSLLAWRYLHEIFLNKREKKKPRCRKECKIESHFYKIKNNWRKKSQSICIASCVAHKYKYICTYKCKHR